MASGVIWGGSSVVAWLLSEAMSVRPMQRPPVAWPLALTVLGFGLGAAGGLSLGRAGNGRLRSAAPHRPPVPRRRKWSYWPALAVLSPAVALAVGASIRWASVRYLTRFGLPPAGLASDLPTVLLDPGTSALTVATLILGAVVARRGGFIRVTVALAGAVLLGCGVVTQLAIHQADQVRRGTPVDRPSPLPFGVLARRFQIVRYDGTPSPVSDRALYLGLVQGEYVIWDPASRTVVRIPLDQAALFSVSEDHAGPHSRPAPPKPQSPALAAPSSPAAVPDSSTATMLELVNQARTSAGLPELSLDPRLSSIAAGWASTMAAAGDISHNPALGGQLGQGWVRLTENVGMGLSLESIHRALMESAPHYANLTDPGVSEIGLGSATDGAGTVFVVQDFGGPGP